jgi:hypothetical protein
MSNIWNLAHIVDVFLDEGFLQRCGPEYWINDLPPEYPVWPTDADNANPCPLSCLQIGDYVRCPKHPTENAPARVIGVDGHRTASYALTAMPFIRRPHSSSRQSALPRKTRKGWCTPNARDHRDDKLTCRITAN